MKENNTAIFLVLNYSLKQQIDWSRNFCAIQENIDNKTKGWVEKKIIKQS